MKRSRKHKDNEITEVKRKRKGSDEGKIRYEEKEEERKRRFLIRVKFIRRTGRRERGKRR